MEEEEIKKDGKKKKIEKKKKKKELIMLEITQRNHTKLILFPDRSFFTF